MPSLTTSRLAKPRSDKEFEGIALDMLRLRWRDPNADLNGRDGQGQHGVDIWGQPIHLNGGFAGAQCKCITRLRLEIVQQEVAKAREFRPTLAEYLMVTTSDTDAPLQEQVRLGFSSDTVPFTVHVVFWDDVVATLAQEPKLVQKHWPDYFLSCSEGKVLLEDGPLRALLQACRARCNDADLLTGLLSGLPLEDARPAVLQQSCAVWLARWRGHPERWCFCVASGRREAERILSVVQQSETVDALALVQVTSDAFTVRAGVEWPRVVLFAADGESASVLDLTAASVEALLERADLAGDRATEAREAAARRLESRGTVEDVLRGAEPGAFAWEDFKGRTRAIFERDLRGVGEYLGRRLTVPRTTADESIERFLSACARSRGVFDDESVLVVVGPQGVGKTSAVCRLLEARDDHATLLVRARDLPVHATRPHEWPIGLEEWAGVDLVGDVERFEQYCHRPHLVLVVDGLNEGDVERVRAFFQGGSMQRLLRAGAALVLTCWPTHWRQLFRPLFRAPREVRLDEFTDDELERALAARGVRLDDLPPTVRPLVRRPSLLDRVLLLRDGLRAEGPISRMDVFWADMKYKAMNRWIEAPGQGIALRQHLIDLIRNFQRVRHERSDEVRALFDEIARTRRGERWVEAPRKLMTLADFGFIDVDEEDTLRLGEESLAIATMGLLLCDEVRVAGPDVSAMIERAQRALDEVGDLFEPLEATLHAVGFSLISPDIARTTALVAILLDNRNFEVDRLEEFGRRLFEPLVPLACQTLPRDLFDSPDMVATNAREALDDAMDESRLPWLIALFDSPREEDGFLIDFLVQRHPRDELVVPLLEACWRAEAARGPQDRVVLHLLSAAAAGLASRAVPQVAERLRVFADRGKPLTPSLEKLASAIGHPTFVQPLLRLARKLRYPGKVIAALPGVSDAGTSAALEDLIETRPQLAVARAILDWARRTGASVALSALRKFGGRALSELTTADATQLVLAAVDGGWSRELARWALAEKAGVLDGAIDLAHLSMACGAIADSSTEEAQACIQRAIDLGLPGIALLRSNLHDLPLAPSRRRRLVGRLRRSLDRATSWEIEDPLLAAELVPYAAAREGRARFLAPLADDNTRRDVLQRHVQHLLPADGPKPTEVLARLPPGAVSASSAGGALRYLAWLGSDRVLDYAWWLANQEEPTLGALSPLSACPLDGPVGRAAADLLARESRSLAELVFVAGVWGRARGPLPPTVDAWLGETLLRLDGAPRELALTFLQDVRHCGLGGAIDALARRRRPSSISLLWDALGSGVDVPEAAFVRLLALTSPADVLHPLTLLEARRLPFARDWLVTRIREFVAQGLPGDDDEAGDLVWRSLMGAALTNNVSFPTEPLGELTTGRRFYQITLVRPAAALLARDDPGWGATLLARFTSAPESGYLEEILAPALQYAPVGTRGELLAAIAYDSDPWTAGPRPALHERDNAYCVLARIPPSPDELATAGRYVARDYRALLAWFEAFRSDGESRLRGMAQNEEGGWTREAANLARWYWQQRRELRRYLGRARRDPIGVVRDRMALHLTQRLDGTWAHELDDDLTNWPLAARPLGYWIREAVLAREDQFRPEP